jgi:hypothetical protein
LRSSEGFLGGAHLRLCALERRFRLLDFSGALAFVGHAFLFFGGAFAEVSG